MPYTFGCRSRSQFLFPVIQGLRLHRQELLHGQPITIHLGIGGGYSGEYICKVNARSLSITVDYNYADTTRFPARIKAACIALCLEGFNGTFRISHEFGNIIIRQL
jgi:hypothetical protein